MKLADIVYARTQITLPENLIALGTLHTAIRQIFLPP